jgi:hypothetical protein
MPHQSHLHGEAPGMLVVSIIKPSYKVKAFRKGRELCWRSDVCVFLIGSSVKPNLHARALHSGVSQVVPRLGRRLWV